MLVSLKELLDQAKIEKKAVGAFNGGLFRRQRSWNAR